VSIPKIFESLLSMYKLFDSAYVILESLLLLAISVGVLYVFGVRSKLKCVRDPLSGLIGATITRTSINARKIEQIPAGELLRAELVESPGSGGGITYRIRLVTVSTTTILCSVGTNHRTALLAHVDRINHFIETSSLESISIVQDYRPIGYGVGGFFGIWGLFVLFRQNFQPIGAAIAICFGIWGIAALSQRTSR
jgi:hypothetical protein